MILKEADQLGMIISSFLSLGEHSKMCRKVFELTTKHTERKTLGKNGFRESNYQLLTPMEEAVKVRGKENTWKKWNEAKEKSGAYSKGRWNQKETGNKTLGRNGLTERNNQVITPVEDAVKKEERRKLLEAMD
jgi:hypothetical protein